MTADRLAPFSAYYCTVSSLGSSRVRPLTKRSLPLPVFTIAITYGSQFRTQAQEPNPKPPAPPRDYMTGSRMSQLPRHCREHAQIYPKINPFDGIKRRLKSSDGQSMVSVCQAFASTCLSRESTLPVSAPRSHRSPRDRGARAVTPPPRDGAGGARARARVAITRRDTPVRMGQSQRPNNRATEAQLGIAYGCGRHAVRTT